MNRVQLETSRWVAMVCVLLLLVFSGLEATHAHPDAKLPSSACAICVSVHANAPAITLHPLPTLRPVATVTVPLQTEGKSVAPELALFIRPPPAA
jgi:hypothetical protein